MKNLQTVLFFMCFCCLLSGQNKSQIIELKFSSKININGFRINKVIDNRTVKGNIGYVLKKASVEMQEINFPFEFENYLEQKLQNLLRINSDDPYILVVHEFYLYEKSGQFSKNRYFRMNLEFAKEINGELYSIWKSQENLTMNISNNYEGDITNQLQRVLINFMKINKDSIKGNLIKFIDRDIMGFHLPRKKGLYKTYEQLVKNEPYKISDYTIKKETHKAPKYHVINKKGKKTIRDILFFSDGVDIYMGVFLYSKQLYFSKCKEHGRYLYFEDRYDSIEKKVIAGALFGLGGGAVPSRVKPLVLDTKTGIIHKLSPNIMRKILVPYPEVHKAFNKYNIKKLKAYREAIMSINEIERNRKD